MVPTSLQEAEGCGKTGGAPSSFSTSTGCAWVTKVRLGSAPKKYEARRGGKSSPSGVPAPCA
ncbi:hypothetical protein [Pseudomonas phage vB_Pa-PAC7]